MHVARLICCLTIAACGDQQPTAPRQAPASLAPSLSRTGTASRDTLYIEREIRVETGREPQVLRQRWVVVGSPDAPLDTDLLASAREQRIRQMGSTAWSVTDARAIATMLPLTMTTAPVRLRVGAASCTSRHPWTTVERGDDASGIETLSEGRGTEPATRVVLRKDGRPMAAIERTWARRGNTWEARRQVTTMLDGRIVETLTFRRNDREKDTLDDACPRPSDRQPGPSSSRPSGFSASTSRTIGSSQTAPTSGCTEIPGEDEVAAACESERITKEMKALQSQNASLTAIAVCALEPLPKTACVLASAAAFNAYIEYAGARAAYESCVQRARQPRPAPCPPCHPPSPQPPGGNPIPLGGLGSGTAAPANCPPEGGGGPPAGPPPGCWIVEIWETRDGGSTWYLIERRYVCPA